MLEAIELYKKYSGGARAVRGVTLRMLQGETMGLAGESGCGKSTLGKLLTRLEEPDSGRVLLDGTDYTQFAGEKMRNLRRKIQIVFQDSSGSLNPRLTVAQILSEPLNNYFRLSARERKAETGNLLDMVGLQPEHSRRFPHELSGGQRQRVGIARALAVQPEWIICDEPVSSLDVLIQAQILKLFEEIKEERKISLLFISHDLSVLRRVSTRIAIMYEGQIVEVLPAPDLKKNATHPYTQELLRAVPELGVRRQYVKKNIFNESFNRETQTQTQRQGCSYLSRCGRSMEQCLAIKPKLIRYGTSQVACHFPGQETNLEQTKGWMESCF